MEPKVKNVEFERVVTSVEFDQTDKTVICVKRYFLPDSAAPIHSEEVVYDLRTMPLSVALQLASAYVQQIGLVDYE